MQWTREGELAQLWEAAGLEDVRSGALTVHVSYADFDELWLPFLTGAGPAAAFAPRHRMPDRLGDALHPRRLGVGDEPFELSALAWAVAGRASRRRARLWRFRRRSSSRPRSGWSPAARAGSC